MPNKKSLGNYIEFYGPYNYDLSRTHTTPSRFFMSPPKKSDALRRVLQVRPMQPVPGMSEELPVELAPAISNSVAAANQKPPAAEKLSKLAQAWEVANTPAADLIYGPGTTRDFLVRDVDRMIDSAQRDLDQRAARGEEVTYWDALKSVGLLGTSRDAADLVGSFTSPLGIATSLLGVLGRGAQAAKSLIGGVPQKGLFSKTAKLIENRAPAVNRKLSSMSPAVTKAQKVAETLMAVPNVYGLATGRPVETLKSAASVLSGGQSSVSPEEAGQNLANLSGFRARPVAALGISSSRVLLCGTLRASFRLDNA